jgi:hypothetical protein
MHDYELDETVEVVPTQGGYQKALKGKVIKVTKSQVVVADEKHHWGVTYRRVDGLPAFKADRGFPCFRVQPVKT